MAGKARQTLDSVALENALRDHPEAFHFFDALRRLECAHPDRPRFGRSVRPTEDCVRLCHAASLAFPPRMIERFEPGGEGRPGRLYGWFFGLFGPNGPLPLHLTEYAIDREINARDRTFTAFADIFHHRMLGLLYRAWADARPAVQADRIDDDRFRLYLSSFIGLGGASLQRRDALPDRFKRFFSGRLLQHSRNAESVKQLLRHFFRVSVDIIDFVAEWMSLPESAYLRLGGPPEVACLGRTAVAGEYVWGAQQRFRIRLGPMNMTEFSKFLPGGEALKQLVAAVRTCVGEEMAWDVQLVLNRDEVPATKLGRAGRLGLTTWMAPPLLVADADNVVLRPVG